MRDKTYWSLSAAECLAVVQRAYIEEGNIAQTVRHYYYKLLSAGAIRLFNVPNSAKNAYNHVSELLTDARNDGQFPWDAVVDPGRRSFSHWSYGSLSHFMRDQLRAFYRADIWRGQPRKLEVWVEKDGLAEFANRAVERWRVPVYVAKGYASATAAKDAADRYGNGKGWTLLYAGDFDPSGLDIERSLRDTLRSHGVRPEIVRVALTQQDTQQLPAEAALDLKPGDSRTPGFIKNYGARQKGYELDAMPAGQLRRKLEEAVASYMDFDAFAEAVAVERTVIEETEGALRDALGDLDDRILARLPDARLLRYLVDPDDAA